VLTRIFGGRLYDPLHGIDGERRDLYIREGRIVGPPVAGEVPQVEVDVTDRVVMPGGIDIHTHIGGGKVNIARMMLPEDHGADPVARTAITHGGCGHAAPSTRIAGYRYAEMGYTSCFEPAMLPVNARQAHIELADTPMVDKGAYALLGNDDFLLRMLAAKEDPQLLNDYVAWTLRAAQAMAVKVVNPGGINAFKFNQRKLDLDEENELYGLTPRTILKALARAVHALGIAHPLHVHGCNLGVAGNLQTTLDTIEAAEGLPLHLTHLQFHSYGKEGDRSFSSGAPQVAEAVNRSPNISIDVGQAMFGQTVTASGDTMRQYAGHPYARPKKWVCMDIECDGGCGVVPFRYRDRNFVHALQWTIGLELFLLVDDPWRIFLTTDHPNGAPFTSYPHLIRLLMDRSFRKDMLASIHAEAAQQTALAAIDREYSLYEIAIVTRAGPARSLGLTDRGHLGPGAAADMVVYEEQADRERMFARPERVFKDGREVVRDAKVTDVAAGATHVVRPHYERGIERSLKAYFERYHTVRMEHMIIRDDEILDEGRGRMVVHDVAVK
jgi:formylmethanofuran dehydrogenase subunit A